MSEKVLDQSSVIGGKYRLEEPIGTGGFSKVFKATHLAMERPVALKIFDPGDDLAAEPDRAQRRLQRFEREAQLVSQLSHPNTVTIFDFGVETDGKLYLVMEYIEGVTLQQVLRTEKPLSQERTVAIFLQLLASLEEAHHLGILHRDLKPANIMLTRNFKGQEIVKVLDFGIAQMLDEPHQEVSARGNLIFLGTPRYAAPEQLTARKLSFASDIFGVGALMWECLVGEKMVPTKDIHGCIEHANSPDPFRLPITANIAPNLARVVEKAVNKNPRERFRDATAMIVALESATSIERSQLPEIKPSPFSASREILDPNITDPEDGENVFLGGRVRAQPPALPGRKPLPKPRPVVEPPAKKAPAPSPSLAAEPLELDLEAVKRSRPRPEPLEKKRSFSLPALPRWWRYALIALVLLGAVALIVSLRPAVSSSDDPAPVAEEQTPRQRQSPFTVQGVHSAIVTADWRFLDRRDPVDLQRFEYHAWTVQKEGIVLDLTVYEVRDTSALESVLSDVRFPTQQIVLGHIAVRLSPRDSHGYEPTTELREHLANYRRLVLEQSP